MNAQSKNKKNEFKLIKLILSIILIFGMYCQQLGLEKKKDNSASTIGIAALASGSPDTTVAPSALSYSGSPYVFPNGVAITTIAPSFTGTVTGCISSPTLPTGLSIAPTTCAISGTPTANQVDTSYTVTASNSLGNTTATINISVVTVAPSALTYSGSPYTFANSSAITAQTPTKAGSVLTSCTSAPTLPTGLSINNTNCAISGTPTVTQVATSYTITATNSLGNTNASINIAVVFIAPSALTYTGSPYTFTNGAAIVSQLPTKAGSPLTNCAASPSLPAGLSINTSTCAITGTPTVNQAATSYTITATNSVGNTTANIMITVNAAAPSSLSYTSSPFTFTNGATIATQTPTVTGTVTSCISTPTLPTGLSINANTCAISGTPTVTQAATSYTITATNSAGNTTANIIITVNMSAPSALTYTGSPYTFTNGSAIAPKTPTVTGTVTNCTSSPTLPAGLSISATTCTISGTPTVNQAATGYTITASNSSGNTTTNINITVNVAAPSSLAYTGSPYTFTNGITITAQTPTVTGTVTNCTASPTLPTGLGINPSTCSITGTPTVTQAATSYTITASNISGNTTTSINITVNMSAPSALAYTGSPYTFTNSSTITTQTPTVTGTVTSCISSPTLPAGLGINNTTCAISGTPTVNQAATSYTITASNISGNTTANISIQINNIVTQQMGGAIQGNQFSLSNVSSILAGGSTVITGSTDGTGSAASFNRPTGITSDGTNLYVTDSLNHTIRKIVIATGVVSTFAGSAGTSGSTNGTGIAARFNRPNGITTDGTNLYITETNNHTVRQIVISSAVVTTLAGATGTTGSTNATGTGAQFNSPIGIVATGGNLYIADSLNQTIRKVVISTGVVTTYAGTVGTGGSTDATGTAATFSSPYGITTDGTNLYVTQVGRIIRKIVISTAVVTTFAGSGAYGSADGVGTAATFLEVEAIGTDGTNLFVSDVGNYTVRKIVISTATVSTLLGMATAQGASDGTGYLSRFYSPGGFVTVGSNLYISDYNSNTIRQAVISSGVVTTLAGTLGGKGVDNATGTGAKFNTTEHITTDGTNIYVADYWNNLIRKVVISTGAVTTLAGSGIKGTTDATGTAATFDKPKGITTDGTNVFVTEYASDIIRKIAISTGVVTTLAGSAYIIGSTDATGSSARFLTLNGITTDGTNLYALDRHAIRKVVISTAVVTTLAGVQGTSGSTDAIGTNARFLDPNGITTDGTNLFVADKGNHTIRKIVISTGTVTTLAGSAGLTGTTNGTGSVARFDSPRDVTMDGLNLYVVEGTFPNSSLVRKIVVSTGAVTSPFSSGSDSGIGGVTTDGMRLFIADTQNAKIVKIQ